MLRLPTRMARKRTFRFFLAFGFILLSSGGAWAWKQWTFIGSARKAVGKIEGYEKRMSTSRSSSGGSRRRTLYCPTFTFQDDQGRGHRIMSSRGGWKAVYAIGQNVEVLYDPRNPTDARINTYIRMWLGQLMIGGVGLIFFSVGVAGLYRGRGAHSH